MTMNKHSVLLTAIAVAAGICLPFAAAGIQDMWLDTHAWPIEAPEHYAYYGTLENRAQMLTAWRNGAAGVSKIELDAMPDGAEIAEDYWRTLYEAGLLPDSGDGGMAVNAFALNSEGFAEYSYAATAQSHDGGALNTIADGASGRVLAIELHCDVTALTAWLAENPLMELAQKYAHYWGYDAVSEGKSAYSDTGIILQNANINGTRCTVSVYALPSSGLLTYNFRAS